MSLVGSIVRVDVGPDLGTPVSETAEHFIEHDVLTRYATVGIFVILIIAGLSITKSIAMPIVAGVIFGLILGPAVDRLAKIGIPHSAGAAMIVLAGLLVCFAMVVVFAAPFAIWSSELPGMIETLRQRLSVVGAFSQQIEGVANSLATSVAPKVEVANGNPLIDIALTSTAAAGGFLIFIATIYFYLATRRHFKAQMLRLCLGRNARQSAGAFFDEIERRTAAYFGTVTLINLAMGAIAVAIAWFSGLPFPPLWGAMVFVLNYVAFIGPIIATALFVAGGLIGETSLLVGLLPSLLFFSVHVIEGNVVTPIAVGRRLTLSPFMVFLSFVFWLWLWGPVGAILAIPILLVGSLAREAIQSYRKTEAQQSEQNADLATATGGEAEARRTTLPVLPRP
jgi:predicted PurR-regulated permease PerM